MKVRTIGLLAGLLLTGGLAGMAFSSEEAARDWETWPRYDSEGRLLRPGNEYREWVFMGSSLGLGYGNAQAAGTVREESDLRRPPEDVGSFHNVYMNPEAYREYARSGEFPDGTVFVLDLYEAKSREPRGIVTRGHFPGRRVGFEMAVKNSRRPDGQESEWAYYSFSGPGGPRHKAAPAHRNSTCHDCHRDNAAEDHVWTQFYPTLQALKNR